MRKLKRMLRNILEKAVFWIERKLGCTYWLHIGDVLTPCDGMITGGQYLVSTRIKDVTLIKAGREPVWQNKMTQLSGKKSEEQLQQANEKFVRLVSSLDRRGMNPNVAKLSISDDPICLNNGTHRIAYMALYTPNAYLPFERIEKDLKPWFPVDGAMYWKKMGLTEEEIRELHEQYFTIINQQVRTHLSGYCLKSHFDAALSKIEKYGKIETFWDIEIESRTYVYFTWKLYKQSLYTDKKQVKSAYVQTLCAELDRLYGNEWGSLAHTVTESISLENTLEDILDKELIGK